MELFNIRHREVPADAVNIMRPGPWGNPFDERTFGREGCIKLYEHWLFLNPNLVTMMRRELAHKDIVCCCWPKACHGDVILRVVGKGEEPQPMNLADATLARYLALQPDQLDNCVREMVEALNYEERPRDKLPLIQRAWDKMAPHLHRMLSNRREGWPKPPTDTVQVLRGDILAWRKEWLETQQQIAEQEPGTDIVTPFDHYLYGSKPHG